MVGHSASCCSLTSKNQRKWTLTTYKYLPTDQEPSDSAIFCEMVDVIHVAVHSQLPILPFFTMLWLSSWILPNLVQSSIHSVLSLAPSSIMD